MEVISQGHEKLKKKDISIEITYKSTRLFGWIFWINIALILNKRCLYATILNPNDSLGVCLFKITFRTILSFDKRLLFAISK